MYSTLVFDKFSDGFLLHSSRKEPYKNDNFFESPGAMIACRGGCVDMLGFFCHAKLGEMAISKYLVHCRRLKD